MSFSRRMWGGKLHPWPRRDIPGLSDRQGIDLKCTAAPIGAEVKDVQLLRSDFIADLCLGRNRPFDQTVEPMDRAARTLLSSHVGVMGRPCDLCSSVNVGLHAIIGH